MIGEPSEGFKSCPRVGHLPAVEVHGLAPRFKSCPRVGGIMSLISDVGQALSFKSCPRVGASVESAIEV